MTTSTTTAPKVGDAVSGHHFGKWFVTGYVREVRTGDVGSTDVVVEVVHGHRSLMGKRTFPAEWLTVEASPNADVVAAATALTGTEVEVTLTDRFGVPRRGFVGVEDGMIWLTDGRGSGSGYEPAEVLSITIGGQS